MPILHDAHVNAYYDALQQSCEDPGLTAYCAWLNRLDIPEGYEIF